MNRERSSRHFGPAQEGWRGRVARKPDASIEDWVTALASAVAGAARWRGWRQSLAAARGVTLGEEPHPITVNVVLTDAA